MLPEFLFGAEATFWCAVGPEFDIFLQVDPVVQSWPVES